MLRIFNYLLIVILLCYSCGGGSYEKSQETEKASTQNTKASSETSGNDYFAKHVSGMNATDPPKADDVPFDPYPDAIMITWQKGQEINGKTLDAINLVSTDSPDEVKSFYESQLEGWSYENVYGIHVFTKNPDAGIMQSDKLEIGEFSREDFSAFVDHVPEDTKTLINLVYVVE